MSATKKFGKNTTALEVVEGIDLNGYEAVITGGNSGIGVETVRALAKAGARCILCARDTEQAKSVAKDIIDSTGNINVEVEKLELDSLQSIDEFVQRFNAKKRPLNILVNNAGVMASKFLHTRDGFENQFGINHMGHFALTLGLLPALKAGAKAKARKSRVVNLSSIAHGMANVDFNDINFKNKPYNKWESYGQAKGCNILFSVGLTKRFANEGIFSNAVMPGVIMTNLQRNMDHEEWAQLGWLDENGNLKIELKTVASGASTTVWAATTPELEGKGGLYLENCSIARQEEDVQNIWTKFCGHTTFVVDENNADKLWSISEQFLKNRGP